MQQNAIDSYHSGTQAFGVQAFRWQNLLDHDGQSLNRGVRVINTAVLTYAGYIPPGYLIIKLLHSLFYYFLSSDVPMHLPRTHCEKVSRQRCE